MKKYSITFILSVFLFTNGFAQSCKDSLRDPDPNHIIQRDYKPVCGCDGKTYRNSDAAYWWGGLALGQWSTDNTICDDFDIDLYPNVSTTNSTEQSHLFIYMKYSGNATLTIYNTFGTVMFQRLFSTSLSEQIIPDANPYDLKEVQTFDRGIYILIVTVNGDRKYRKILRVTE